MRVRRLATIVSAAAIGCAAESLPTEPPGRSGIYDVDTTVRTHPRGDRPVGDTEVHRGVRVSVHVLEVVDAIAPHRNPRSDETLVCWRGGGLLRLGDEAREIQAGMVIHVPRGMVHAFRRTSPEPAIVVSMLSPPFVDGDRVPAE